MKPRILILLLIIVQMSMAMITYGNSESPDSPINAMMFKFLLETLINADEDLTEKLEELEKKCDMQNAKNSELEGKLLATEQISTMQQTRISKLENDLLTTKQNTKNQLDQLNDKVSTLEDYKKEMERNSDHNAAVAFFARVSPIYQDISPGAVIKFNQVDTNVGNAYNTKTGEFDAPRGGLYVFYSNIHTKSGSVLETVLKVNWNTKLWLYSAGTGDYGSGDNLLVVHLDLGDKVKMVQSGAYGKRPFYIHHGWSTFSGFLLRSDSI